MINMYKIIYLLVFLLSRGWEIFLYYLNLKHSLKENKVPDIFKETISEEEFKESKNYLKDKTNFIITETIFKTVITLIGLIYLFPLFEKIATNVAYSSNNGFKIFNSGYTQIIIFFFFLGILYFLIDLPFDIYDSFYLEKRYGFSKINLKLYLSDKIKTILISIILGFLLLFGFFKIIFSGFNYWWLSLSILIIVVIFLINIIYPTLLLPLF